MKVTHLLSLVPFIDMVFALTLVTGWSCWNDLRGDYCCLYYGYWNDGRDFIPDAVKSGAGFECGDCCVGG
ncbi:hypothetical protein EDM56_14675 [Brevibacillus fluminis]|uniref:Uncharacterized protein n=1 Tax=Brevibacillus fluminis TaxID=511487 RepID=A0A3M8DFZ3_9BACL|nr:hypothetical protein [Brevibacillus fluminis]RNB86954.1 hypothetical protein EDM56_14675 [Brevibacillus fluminis]